jgi:hypothetical protein
MPVEEAPSRELGVVAVATAVGAFNHVAAPHHEPGDEKRETKKHKEDQACIVTHEDGSSD